MKIIPNPRPRRDGKILVSLGFSNGVWLRKLWTPEQLAQAIEKEKQPPNNHDTTHCAPATM